MFTDMVGYTSLSQRNESLALALLDEQRRLVRPHFARHNGKEIKTIGDGFLVEFASALEAVRCAFDVQQSMHESNATRALDSRMMLRIGIHVGDVVFGGGDIHGDAVNIASRIEAVAESGGICITEQVFDQVRNKFEFPIVALGPRELKSVQLPMQVYKIVLPWEKGEEGRLASERRRIAVLPLVNMISGPADEYFADGMTEELISAVSKIHDIRVIARTSVMKYKGGGKGIAEISRELKVGSVLEGSVRKAGSRLRMMVQLVDAGSEEHLWSENYDRELGDVFAIQSDIAQRVAEALKVELLSSEKSDIEKKPTNNPEAYTLYLKGRYHWNERTRAGNDKAVKYNEKAVELDPGFALAYAALADCHVVSQNYGWRMPRDAFSRAKEYALKAIEIDPGLAEPHASLAFVYAGYEYKWREAEEEFKLAMGLKASYAYTYQWYSLILRFMGRLDESYEQIKRASALDPLSRVIGINLGFELLAIGRTKEAIEQYRRVIESNPDYAHAHFELGWAYYTEARMDEAIEELRKSAVMSGDDPHYKAELACLLGFAGRRGEANKIIDELEALSKSTYVNTAKIAFALFGAGRVDEAFSYLEKSYDERADQILYFRTHPGFEDFLRDPRWASLEKRLGLSKN